MGCMLGKNDLMSAYREEQMPIAKQLACAPRKLPTGDTFIPVNYIDGTYPSKYPVWLIEDLSPKKYAFIIQRLNDLNAFSPLWDQRMLEKYRKMTKKNSSKVQSAMAKDKKKFNKQIDALLQDINRKILNPRSLNAKSKLNEEDPSTMGIIIEIVRTPKGSNKKTQSKTIDDSEGKFIILPVYNKENYICNADDRLSETEESSYGH